MKFDGFIYGLIYQASNRIKALKAKIDPRKTEDGFDALASRCEVYLESLFNRLNNISKKDELSEKLEEFKKIYYEISDFENKIMVVVTRGNKDDVHLTKIVKKVCNEIHFPLHPPAAACLSQQYYQIYPKLKLICTPLLESYFLLHIPDLYHELGHLLLDTQEDPRSEAFVRKLGDFRGFVQSHYKKQVQLNQRKTNDKNTIKLYKGAAEAWTSTRQGPSCWSIEFFCDIFGVFTLGSAYAWSHLYLTSKYTSNLYGYSNPEHPAANARMQIMLQTLNLMNLISEKNDIQDKWNELLTLESENPDNYYELVYPDALLETCTIYAFEGIKNLESVISSTEQKDTIINSLLNNAWKEFWKDSILYSEWEKNKVKELKDIFSS